MIVGCGRTGSFLALTLSQKQHNVVVIDKNPKVLEKIGRSADVATRLGSATDWHLLEAMIEFSPDVLICMTSEDETNLVTCAIAKNLGYPKTVARIRQNHLLESFRLDFERLFYVDHIIGTELIVANDIFKCMLQPGALAVQNFSHGSVQLRTIVIPDHFGKAGKPLSELYLHENLLVGLIRRKTEKQKEEIIFPKEEELLFPGDEATVIGETKKMHQLHDILGMQKKIRRSVVIVGASGVAIHLCHLLEEQKIEIKVIEKEEIECQKLAKMFPSATILNHDGTDFDFLLEERVDAFDVFVACTYSHETNILAAALAKQAGCKEVIALVCEDNISPLLEKLGITYALSERASIASKIHAILHEASFISTSSLYGDRAKVMEIRISADSEIVGTPLGNISAAFPQKSLIALIENREGIMVAKNDSVLMPGDTAIVICCPETALEMEKIL